MQSLNEDLKTGQFKHVYLLFGEEAYLKKLYIIFLILTERIRNRWKSLIWQRQCLFLQSDV